MFSNHEKVLRGLALVNTAGELGLNLDNLDDIGQGWYSGDLVTETAKRLHLIDEADHSEAFERIKQQLTPFQALQAARLCEKLGGAFGNAIHALFDHELLSADDGLLAALAGASLTEINTTLHRAFRMRDGHQITCAEYLKFATAQQLPAGRVLASMRHFWGQIEPADADTLVKIVAEQTGLSLPVAVELARRSPDGWVLPDSISLHLLERGSVADLAVVCCLGRHADQVLEKLLAIPEALCLVTAGDLLMKYQVDALKAGLDAESRDLWYVDRPAALVLLKDFTVTNPRLVLSLVKKATNARAWLHGIFPRNLPNAGTMRLAVRGGLFDASEIASTVASYHCVTADWWPAIVAETPGIAPVFARMLARVAEHHRDTDYAQQVAQLARVVQAELGDDPQLWQRLVLAAPGSPFEDETLTVRQAADIYRERWANASARKASNAATPWPDSDFRNCQDGHGATARHPRSACAAG